MTPAALILCGGRSRRMGRSKADLPFGPESMLTRVTRRVAEVARPVVIVAAPDQELPALPGDIRIARDPVADRGPLQGLAAGMAALPDSVELVYATATDVPFLRPAWIERLVGLLGDHDLAIPYVDGYHHPLAALYRRPTVQSIIDELLRADRLRPVFLMELVRTRIVTAEELRDIDPELETLHNLNTPEDYHQALARAGFAPEHRITIELYGVPRLRAGVGQVVVTGATVSEALAALAEACPNLAGSVIDGPGLHRAYRLNLNGDRFVSDPAYALDDGDTLILLAADVGG